LISRPANEIKTNFISATMSQANQRHTQQNVKSPTQMHQHLTQYKQ